MRRLFLVSATAATVVAGLGAGGGAALAQSGSYQRSCRNATTANGVLMAECADTTNQYRTSTLPYGQCRGDISNHNGVLSCAGATGTAAAASGNGNRGGQGGNGQGYAQNGQNNTSPNNNGQNQRRDNNGQIVAGVVAGAVIGGLLADDSRQGPPPPPAYGAPPPGGYGDPRYAQGGQPGYGGPGYGGPPPGGYGDRPDPNYAPGGWAYGHQAGEWVPIRERADWFEKRIARAQSTGQISPRQARDLRRQLYAIEDAEEDYMRDGRVGLRERIDLDHRFNDLAVRIRFDQDRF